DERLRAILFGSALALGELDTAAAIAATLELPEAWRIVTATRDTLAALEQDAKRALWSAFAPAITSSSFAEGCVFAGQLYEIMRVPAPSALMEPDRTAKPWKHWLDTIKSTLDAEHPVIPELAIALADRTHRGAWRERIEALSPAIA